MKFYRLEKINYFKFWTIKTLKALLISLLLCVALMVCIGYKFMIVTSGSMEPTLPVGSLVIVTPCDYDDLQLWDIVTMEGSGLYLTHRVCGKVVDGNYVEGHELEANPDAYPSDAKWYTKGDASDTIDGELNRNIVGKIYEGHCFKFVGTIVRYVKANYYMLIVFVVILVAFVEVLNWLKSKLETDDIECYELDDEE